MPKSRRPPEETPTLFPSRAPWETRGIFSDHFLKTRLHQAPSWPKNDDTIRPIYDYLLELWHRRHVGLEKGNEETTCREFLEPVLSRLGFSCLYKEDLPASASRMVPDYLLFSDEETKESAFDSDAPAKYEAATSLLEAKKVGHPLDAISKSEHRFPHQQVRDYLSNATDQIGRPYFRWAILTNGNYWRLYCRDARPDAYFEFRLAGPKTNFCHFDEFKAFITLFSSSVFVETDGICLLDQIRQEALHFQQELEESIRRRVAVVVRDLANGFWSFKENNLNTGHLRGLYDACLILLYRLLFVLYAEGRGLLPVKPSGAGANVNYRERYSLSRFVNNLRSRTEYLSDDLTDLYEDLRKLFHLINGDRPSANNACGVPLYNGGLFDRKSHPNLEEWRIGDKLLANVLRDLIFSVGPSQRAKQMEFEWGTIDYADLEVRQLGDIYEGLLGGHLEVSTESNELEVMGEHAALQESGTFYTPDWVVRFLVERTLRPLIERIEQSATVQKSEKAEAKDNAFASEVLTLNILDPAMGSGHFLVRATEWLADEIVFHPTTRFQIEKVAPGTSQEQAEISYWRRRVVEACIYGVDMNPLAVELAKLSLWLTCIASEEPLNFLDHHLRPGNSLIGASVSELASLPPDKLDHQHRQTSLSLGITFLSTVGSAIKEITSIETESSDRIDIVKDKEQRWNDRVLAKLQPFKDVADLWIAGIAGLPITQFDYCQIGQLLLTEHIESSRTKRELTAATARFEAKLKTIKNDIAPFHWELEFPDVFYEENGQRRANPGFDSVLGNPPYISTQTSSEFNYRDTLKQRFGFTDDLYVHFVDKSFTLLRKRGRFGFIISDTFFTLNTKLRLRELLQSNQLDYLVQCDPFEATVDAAMFVTEKVLDEDPFRTVTFIHARNCSKDSEPENELSKHLPIAEREVEKGSTTFRFEKQEFPVFHRTAGCLRIHQTTLEPYRRALKKCFFEPTEAVVRLYNRFNEPMKRLVATWWEKIDTSKTFADKRKDILAYQKTLSPGEITLVGLVAEGGQGICTANNGRFLGYLEGTPQAKAILERRPRLISGWEKNQRVAPAFRSLLKQYDGDFVLVVESLKQQFHWTRDLKLQKGEIYRVVPSDRIATQEDFKRAFQFRKEELENLWHKTSGVSDLYDRLCSDEIGNFFKIATGLVEEMSGRGLGTAKLGLRQGEVYSDPDDAQRVATIYSGLPGKRTWVPYRKGDPEGNKWTTVEPLFIEWGTANVSWLWANSGHPEPNMPVIRNAHLYFTPGITWTRHANHVGLKARLQPSCVFDANGSRLTPLGGNLTANQFLAILNADLFSFIVKKFIKNTQDYEINDLRMAPLVVPTRTQAVELEKLAKWAVKAKELSLHGADPTPEMILFCKTLTEKQRVAPSYLQPDSQMRMFHSIEDCLAVIDLGVNWEVEQLYGVEGLGPFSEF